MALTDTAVRQAKPAEKAYKLADGKGLYLFINQAGKYWRFDYRFQGKRKTLALGVYPDVTLAAAREAHLAARRHLTNGIDPCTYKKEVKAAQVAQAENAFECIAREWHLKNKPTWVDNYAEKIIKRLEQNVFPWIGNKSITSIEAPELLTTIQRIEKRGALETAHRTMQNCGQIFRYAIATGRAKYNPANDLLGALAPIKRTSYATMTDPRQIAELLKVINGYQGGFVTQCALRLAPMLFVRPGELRSAEWTEIDFEKAEWRIPGQRMKMREQHIVPLARQALEIFREIHYLTGNSKYVFPSVRSLSRPMSENTINGALRRLGYDKDTITGHGFRHMASTLLNEHGWNRDAIERQLAHAERNKVRAVYNFAEYLPERRKMMQWWADYLEELANEK